MKYKHSCVNCRFGETRRAGQTGRRVCRCHKYPSKNFARQVPMASVCKHYQTKEQTK